MKKSCSPIVIKFGGTSIGTLELMKKAALRIRKYRRLKQPLIVVVSAMGHTTDHYLALAHQLSTRPDPRELDMLLTTGERISMALLGIALKEVGVSSISFTGSQAGILTSRDHQNARIISIDGRRVFDAISEEKVAIVAGYQGVSDQKEITTLGRGGSDTTAVALAARFGAKRCEILTDVAGVFSADPRIVKGARLIPQIDGKTMCLFARAGAGVLHYRAAVLAQKNGIPLWIGLSRGSDFGTQVFSKSGHDKIMRMESSGVLGVTSDPNPLLGEFKGSIDDLLPGIEMLASDSLEIEQVGSSVYLSMSQESFTRLQRLLPKRKRESLTIFSSLQQISIIGYDLNGSKLLPKITKIIKKYSGKSLSPVLSADSSRIKLWVRKKKTNQVIRALHDQVVLKEFQ